MKVKLDHGEVKSKTREVEHEIAREMAEWQRIEDRNVSITAEVMEKTDNPVLRMVMEIIQTDSRQHHRVQQFVVEAVEGRAFALTPEQLGEISELLDRHMRAEEEMMGRVVAALDSIKGRKLLVPEYFLRYLHQDECKHAAMLADLDAFKRGLYPYA